MAGLCIKDKTMNLGFDLDEVISQTSWMALEHVNNTLDLNYTLDVFEKYWFEENFFSPDEAVQQKVIRLLYDAIKDPALLTTSKPYPGAKECLQEFKGRGHSIFIITKRPLNQFDATFNWLNKNDIPFDGLHLTKETSKGKLANELELDMFVDDLEENLHDMHAHRYMWSRGLLLMTRNWNKNNTIDHNKFSRVHDWDAILNRVVGENND